MKDLTPQEAVKEARKIIPKMNRLGWVQAMYYETGKGQKMWGLEVSHSKSHGYVGVNAKTLRSCLAKLKKKVK